LSKIHSLKIQLPMVAIRSALSWDASIYVGFAPTIGHLNFNVGAPKAAERRRLQWDPMLVSPNRKNI
jgi:hypothetical protein